jgi:hypothetical protein
MDAGGLWPRAAALARTADRRRGALVPTVAYLADPQFQEKDHVRVVSGPGHRVSYASVAGSLAAAGRDNGDMQDVTSAEGSE